MLLFTRLQRLHTTKYTNISIKHLTQLEDYRTFHENLILIHLLNKSPDAAHPSEIFPPIYLPRQRHILQDCHLRHSTPRDPLKYYMRYLKLLRINRRFITVFTKVEPHPQETEQSSHFSHIIPLRFIITILTSDTISPK